MCPANSWHHAKDLLHAEVKILLGILRHKKLSIKEYRYIVQSVLMSKLRYYLTVVPMTNRELDHIDARITAVLKHDIGAAISTSSPLLHMYASTSTGLSFLEGVHDPEIPQNSVARCDYRIPEFLRIPGIPQNSVARCNYKTLYCDCHQKLSLN